MGEVVKLYPNNAAVNADNVLELALGNYDQVLIIGWDKAGVLDARATLGLENASDILWLVEVFKAKMMNGDYSGD